MNFVWFYLVEYTLPRPRCKCLIFRCKVTEFMPDDKIKFAARESADISKEGYTLSHIIGSSECAASELVFEFNRH